jgi:hypothetical protein
MRGVNDDGVVFVMFCCFSLCADPHLPWGDGFVTRVLGVLWRSLLIFSTMTISDQSIYAVYIYLVAQPRTSSHP